MTDLDALKTKARSIDAIIVCDGACSFSEPFAEFLGRDDRVDEEDEALHVECPSCGHDTMRLGRESGPRAFTVSGLAELEELAGE